MSIANLTISVLGIVDYFIDTFTSRKQKEKRAFTRSMANTNLNSKKETDHPESIDIEATIHIYSSHDRLHNVCKIFWRFHHSSIELHLRLMLHCYHEFFHLCPNSKSLLLQFRKRTIAISSTDLEPRKCAMTHCYWRQMKCHMLWLTGIFTILNKYGFQSLKTCTRKQKGHTYWTRCNSPISKLDNPNQRTKIFGNLVLYPYSNWEEFPQVVSFLHCFTFVKLATL